MTLISIKQAAGRYEVSELAIHRLIRQKKIKPAKGKTILLDADNLQTLYEKGEIRRLGTIIEEVQEAS